MRHSQREPGHPTQAPTSLEAAFAVGVALACALVAGPVAMATPATPSPQKPPREQLTIDLEDVDWLLMAAQGYQESRLDQEARSHVGAIGVMQIMPATGKDLNVGDITEVETNIHAGIKYMRWMIDNYYDKEPMTRLDKALFAFASYNAGAGRLSQLRKEAAKRGLDPNVWFHNVEYIAAEKIGAETVTYVSNIYKYYIAYQLIMEARAAREKAAEQLKSQPH